jgi:hypothetical protein
MTRLATVLAFLLVATPVVAPTTAHASEEATSDIAKKIGMNVREEAQAIRALAKVIKAEVEAGNVELTEAAKGKWKQGTELWDKIIEKAKAEDYKGAYAQTREARRLMAEAFSSAFEGKPSNEVRSALKAYFDAVEPRVAGVKKFKESNELPADAASAYETGKVKWTEAKDYAKGKEYGKAFASVLAGMDELDQVIRFVYESKK